MPVSWKKVAGVFSSILDGTLLDKLGQFTDNQLRPFLPLLIANTFSSEPSEQKVILCSRLTNFTEGNRCIQLLQMDFSDLIADLKSPKMLTYPYQGSKDYDKIKLIFSALLRRDQKEEKDDKLSAILTDENLDEVILLIQVAYLSIPQVFELEHIVFKALGVPNGYQLIIGLVSNAPELLDPVLNFIKAIQISDECARGRERACLLDLLFCLYPPMIWPIVTDLSQNRRDGLLALRLGCVHIIPDNQALSFLSSQLIHRDSDTVTSQMIAKSSARPTLDIIYGRLMKIAKNSQKASPASPLTEVIRLLVFLQQHCIAKLNNEQLQVFCGLLCRTIGDDSHLIFSLAVLMSVQAFTLPVHQAGVMSSIDDRILKHFQWLKSIVNSNSRPTLNQHLMYIAACVYSAKRDQLNSMFSELLRIKITLQPRHLDVLSNILQDNFLKSEEIALECTKLPITPNLNMNSGQRLPINTVYLCFVKHGVDITPWLEAQLQSCSYPIHNLLPELIERFAMMATRVNLPGLTKQFVNAAFDGELMDEKAVPLRVLTFLFLLAYRSNLDQLGSKAFEIHGSETFTKLPARYLLSIAMSRTKDFAPIQAPLIRLATDICPYMLPTVASVNAVTNQKIRTIPLQETCEQLSKMIENPEQMRLAVKNIRFAPISDQVRNIKNISRAFVATLDKSSPVGLIESIASLFCSLQNYVPRMLFEVSATEWLGGSAVTLLLSDIYEYPSLLFRCDRRIFSSPLHFKCFIDLLDFFMQASKNNLHRKIHAANVISKSEVDRVDRESLSVAFDNTQASLIVQLLVEVSDENKMRDDLSNEAALIRRRKVRDIACAFMHQMFIADPPVMKLVLFQGLPLERIRSLVEGIPSMHIAVDFLQEMLTLPDLNRRICGVALMVHISRKYRVVQSANMMDFIINILNTLLRYAESFLNVKLFIKVVPTLAEIISVFPQLSGDITSLLLRVSSMAKGRLTLHPLVIKSDCEEQQLIDLVSKSLNEQLESQSW